MSNSDWREVTHNESCPVCGKGDWCGRTQDGAVRCMRVSDPPSGWCVVKKCEDGGTVFALDSDSQGAPRGSNDWHTKAANFHDALPADKLISLATALHVSPEALRAVAVGWNRHGYSFTFPERDGKRQIIGIATRRPSDGQKLCIKGSHRGLVIPDGFDANGATVPVVEGATDVVACVTMGLNAVGRPNAMGGVAPLAELLADANDILIVGERDRKENGDWPGRDGAQRVAGALARRWGRPVSWTLPPEGTKDVRQYLVDAKPNLTDTEACKAVGVRLLTELRKVAVVVQPKDKIAAPSEPGDEKPRKSQADMLVELAASADLFHTPGGYDSEGYAVIEVGDHRETWPIVSKGFRRWLGRQFHNECGKAPGSQAVQDATNVIVGKAIFDGPECEAPIRLAEHGGGIYLDLCNSEWQAVEISGGGWRVLDSRSVPVRFRRRRGMLALPMPLSGGSVDGLREFVNVPNNDDWTLLVAWIIQALQPQGPYPILILNGEQGSAKSYLCRFVRSVIDPNAAPLRRPPRDERDLMIAANNGWVVALDNVSHISPSLSDTLCTLATGSGFGTRELYSDDEEKLFAAARPILSNGIEDVAVRSDLADRAVRLTLPHIPDGRRRNENELLPAFEAARPRILGALLNAVSEAFRILPTVKLKAMPRMADFAKLGAATEQALGWVPGTFLAAYAGSRESANATVLESSVLGPLVLTLIRERGRWAGTATEFLAELETRTDEKTRKRRDWPTTGAVLSNRLRRLSTTLRALGVDVTFHRKAGGGRHRVIELEQVGETPSRPSHNRPGAPENVDSPGRRGDDAGTGGDDDIPLCSNEPDTLPTPLPSDADTDPEPDGSDEAEREAIQAVEAEAEGEAQTSEGQPLAETPAENSVSDSASAVSDVPDVSMDMPGGSPETLPQTSADAAVPAGWLPRSWAARLDDLADKCEGEHPDQAVRYRKQATNIRATLEVVNCDDD